MITKDELTILSRLTTAAPEPLATAQGALDHVQAQLDQIGSKRCTGAISWRKDGPTDRMIVVHKHGESCPHHGQPKSQKGRIRSYIGTDPDKQEIAKDLIAADKRYRDLQSTLRRIDNAISRAHQHIRSYYQALGYSVPWQPSGYPEPRDKAPW